MQKFYGDSTHWGIGVVEDIQDPLNQGRVRVRIHGLHTFDTNTLAIHQLPWSHVAIPANNAGTSGVGQTPTGLVEGSFVFGIFLDGADKQDFLVTNALTGTDTATVRQGQQLTQITESLYGDSNPERMYSYFRDVLGFTEEEAGGALGAVAQFMGDYTLNDVDVDHGEGRYGIGNWDESDTTALRQFASLAGKNYQDFDTQLLFLGNGLQHSDAWPNYSAAGQQLGAFDASQAADSFAVNVLRLPLDQERRVRHTHARQALDAYGSSTTGDIGLFPERGAPTDLVTGTVLPSEEHVYRYIRSLNRHIAELIVTDTNTQPGAALADDWADETHFLITEDGAIQIGTLANQPVENMPAGSSVTADGEMLPASRFTTSTEMRDQIKTWEDIRLEPYVDAYGFSIGYGYFIGTDDQPERFEAFSERWMGTATSDRSQISITRAQAEELFDETLERFENIVKNDVSVDITQSQFDALVAFAYNLGGFSGAQTLIGRLNSGNYEAAADSFTLYTSYRNANNERIYYPADDVTRALHGRRLQEAEFFRRGLVGVNGVTLRNHRQFSIVVTFQGGQRNGGGRATGYSTEQFNAFRAIAGATSFAYPAVSIIGLRDLDATSVRPLFDVRQFFESTSPNTTSNPRPAPATVSDTSGVQGSSASAGGDVARPATPESNSVSVNGSANSPSVEPDVPTPNADHTPTVIDLDTDVVETATGEIADLSAPTPPTSIPSPFLDPILGVVGSSSGLGLDLSALGGDTLTEAEVQALIDGSLVAYYTSSQVDTLLTSYYTSSQVDTLLAARDELGELTDVTLTSPSTGQYLRYNGAGWVNATIDYADITGTPGAGDFVDLISDQTIAGIKNFTGTLRFNGNDVLVASALDDYLPLTGGTLTGNIEMSNRDLTGLRQISMQANTSKDKIRVWNNTTWTMGMTNGITFGPITSYAMTFQSSTATGAGFYWGDVGDTSTTGAMALSNIGELYVNTSIEVNGDIVWHAGNDGAGSGLDADLLDGQHGSYYASAASLGSYLPLTGGTLTGNLVVRDSSNVKASMVLRGSAIADSVEYSVRPASGYSWTSRGADILTHYDDVNTRIYRSTGGGTVHAVLNSSGLTILGNTAWHAGNDGAGSGLDADLLDGLQSSQFLRADTSDTMSGNLTLSGNLTVSGTTTFNLGPSNDVRLYSDVEQYIMTFRTSAGSRRWGFYMHDAEAGSNSGHNLRFIALDDTGGYLADVYEINRATQVVDFDQTPTVLSNTIWTAGNDGSGSGLDADLLDGQHGSYYAAAASYLPLAGGTMTGPLYNVADGSKFYTLRIGTSNELKIYESSTATLSIQAGNSGSYKYFTFGADGTFGVNGNVFWNSSNDGAGSGLDADLLDGQHGSYYAAASSLANYLPLTGGTVTGILTVGSGANISPSATGTGQLKIDSSGYDGYIAMDAVGMYVGHNSGARSLVLQTNETDRLTISAAGDVAIPGAATISALTVTNAIEAYDSINLRRSGAGYVRHRVAGQGLYLGVTSSGGTLSYPVILDAVNDRVLIKNMAATDETNEPGDITKVRGIHFGWASGYGTQKNHGIFSANTSGVYNDDILINSYGNVAITIDSNDNDSLSAKFSILRNANSFTGTPTEILKLTQSGVLTVDGSLVWTAGNDGSGSGLDADLLDGQHGSYYASAASLGSYLPLTGGTLTGPLNINATTPAGGIFIEDSNSSSAAPVVRVQGKRSDGNVSQSFSGGLALEHHYTAAAISSGKRIGTIYFGGNHTNALASNINYAASISGVADGAFNSAADMPTGLVFYTGITGRDLGVPNVTYGTQRMQISSGGDIRFYKDDGTTTGVLWDASSGAFTVEGSTIWTAGNDGSGSGLDADLLDGLQGSQFLRSDVLATQSYGLRITDSRGTSLGNDPLLRLTNTQMGGSGYPNMEFVNGDGTKASFGLNAADQNSYGGSTAMIIGGFSDHIKFTYVSANSSKVTWDGENGIYNFVGTLREDGFNVWTAGNDGSGSGLDADLLDGQHGSYYASTASLGSYLPLTGGTLSGYLQISKTSGQPYLDIVRSGTLGTDYPEIRLRQAGRYDRIRNTGSGLEFCFNYSATEKIMRWTGTSLTLDGSAVWTAGNDGSGSGLDADLLDGQHGSYYASAASLGSYLPLTGGTVTGALTVTGILTANDGLLIKNAGTGASHRITSYNEGSTGTLIIARVSSTWNDSFRLAPGVAQIYANGVAATWNGTTFTAANFSGNGSSLTALNGSNITSGTIADARIHSNLVRRSDVFTSSVNWDARSDFLVRDSNDAMTNFIWRDKSAGLLYLGTPTAAVTFRSSVNLSGNTISNGTFSGNGSSLTALNGSNITSGLISKEHLREVNVLDSRTDAIVDPLPSEFSERAYRVDFRIDGSPTSNWRSVMTLRGWSGTYSAHQLSFNSANATSGDVSNLYHRTGRDSTWRSWRKIWDDGNDGSGSGLDADLLDGQQGSYYASAASLSSYLPLSGGTVSGTLGLPSSAGTNQIKLGTGDGASYTTHNFVLKGWYGMGLTDYTDTVRGHYNFRTGTWDVKGGYKVNGSTVWHAGNDGSGSGLDADLLDGQHGSYYAVSSNPVTSGDVLGHGNTRIVVGFGNAIASTTRNYFAPRNEADTTWEWGKEFGYSHATGTWYFEGELASGVNTTNRYWNAGNDGSGSGLDADLLDGYHATSFGRLAAASTWTATQTFSDNVRIRLGTGADMQMYHNGSTMLMDWTVGNLLLRNGTTTRFTFERTTGNFIATGNVTASSDARLKNLIGEFNGSRLLDNLKVYDYTWKDGRGSSVGPTTQDIRAAGGDVFVTENEDGFDSLDYGKYATALVAELKKKNQSLEDRVEKLEALVQTLLDRI